ncbi:MAG: DUF2225 domain-containing protein [Lachnospiraceae bacterium]|nr:DUF2225 domain-containing protein [Lachnospiraceae bacterium]
MHGILSGLDKIGITGMSNMDIYGDPGKNGEEDSTGKLPGTWFSEAVEKDFLYDKSHSCPVCHNEFKTPTVRANKLRPMGADYDLRPRFEGIDPLKYEVVMCHECGYAALGNYFDKMTVAQAGLIREGITKHYKKFDATSTFTYDQAFLRYQLALGNAVIKRSKASEKAYLCLKMAWLLRGKKEAIDGGVLEYEPGKYADTIREIEVMQKELLGNAIEGFIKAKQSESFPICGIDRTTLDYIIAAEAVNVEDYALALQILNDLIKKPGISKEMEQRCHALMIRIKDT